MAMNLFFASRAKRPIIHRREIVREGWLEKQSLHRKDWHRRWCVLTVDYLCSFLNPDEFIRPTEFLSIGECASAAPSAVRKNAFSVDSPERTFLLVAQSEDERDAWVESVRQVFTHCWRPIQFGDALEQDACVPNVVHSRYHFECVARNAYGECGRLTVKDGLAGEVCCHHCGQNRCGDVLVPREGTVAKWIPIGKGLRLPAGAIYAGRTPTDGRCYVARNQNGELGKMNLLDDWMWNIWVYQSGSSHTGEVLVMHHSDRTSSDEKFEKHLSDRLNDPTYTVDTLLESLEPQDREGNVFEYWREQMLQHRTSGDLIRVGGQFANPPDEAILGAGSFGSVWLARDRNTGENFAIKNMTVSNASRNRKGDVAKNEFRVAERIRSNPHPFIVSLFLVQQFTLSRNSDFYMLVMEYCPNGNMQETIRAGVYGNNYELHPAAHSWLGEIFLALEHLHTEVETMVRDLKPDNIVVSATGRAKLTDFGYGRLFVHSSGGWTFGAPPGSPGYIAPEVLSQEPYDCSVDFYSYGVMAWVLLAGGLREVPEEPVPPSGGRGRVFQTYVDDWRLLADCLRNPGKGRRCLQSEEREFVAALTQRVPGKRPRPAELRQFAFFSKMELPEPRAEPGAVETWQLSPLSERNGDIGRPRSYSGMPFCSIGSFVEKVKALADAGKIRRGASIDDCYRIGDIGRGVMEVLGPRTPKPEGENSPARPARIERPNSMESLSDWLGY